MAPALLSESEAALEAALGLFDPAQLEMLCKDARLRLERLGGEGDRLAGARERLQQMERELAAGVSAHVH